VPEELARPAPVGKKGVRGPTSSPQVPTARLKPLPAEEPWTRRIPTWLPILALVLVGVGIAYAIAMSGPEIDPASNPTTTPRLAPPPTPPPATGKARLTIESTPPGAKVSIDGRERGCATPCTVDDLSVTSPALLRLDKPGYLPWSGLHDPGKAGATRAAKLRKAPADSRRLASLTLRADAAAEVLVGEEAIGHVTTAGPLLLPAGRYKLVLVAPSGARASIDVQLQAGDSVDKSVELTVSSPK
jgi:hypothetical protein